MLGPNDVRKKQNIAWEGSGATTILTRRNRVTSLETLDKIQDHKKHFYDISKSMELAGGGREAKILKWIRSESYHR